MRKILVWHQGALGDLILSLPSMYALKRFAAGYYLHLVSRTDIADIILENELADEISSNESGLFACLFYPAKDLPDALRAFLKGFDKAFIFMKRADSAFGENIRGHIPQSYFVRTVPHAGSSMSVSRFQLEQLGLAGIPTDTEMPVLEAKRNLLLVYPGRTVIAIHPGSGGKKKCWPISNYFALINLLNSQVRYYFVIILGPAEGHEMPERTLGFILGRGVEAEIVREATLADIASLLKMSSLYIGNDSGITHLASILGVPAVALFGPTNHEIWGPAGRHVRVVRSGYPCSPCGEQMEKCADIRCLGTLGVEKVLDAAEELLRGGRL
jgi:heptosyltransferase-3